MSENTGQIIIIMIIINYMVWTQIVSSGSKSALNISSLVLKLFSFLVDGIAKPV
jgi:hypothetical protein